MKARKPLLLALLILALLAAALIVPATATGKSDNKPVAWVSYGAAVHLDDPPGLRVQTLSVRRYADDSFRGHATLQIIKPREMRMMAMAGQGDFVDLDDIPEPGSPGVPPWWNPAASNFAPDWWNPADPNQFMFVAWFDILMWLPGDNGPTLNPELMPSPFGPVPSFLPWPLACYYKDGGRPVNDMFYIYGLPTGPIGGLDMPGNLTVHPGGQAANGATWTGNVNSLPVWLADFSVNVFQSGGKTWGGEYMNFLVTLPPPPTLPPLGENLTEEIVYADFDDSSGVPVATVIFRLNTAKWEPTKTYPHFVYHTFVLTDDPDDPTKDHVAAYAQPVKPAPGGPYGFKFVDDYFNDGVHVFIN